MLGGVTLAQYRLGKRPLWYNQTITPTTPKENDDDMEKTYNSIDEIRADGNIAWSAPIISDMQEKGIVKGKAGGALDLTARDIRTLEFCRRMIAANYQYASNNE
jgi:hypothetical protein